jgi:signal transduction histidine kinase
VTRRQQAADLALAAAVAAGCTLEVWVPNGPGSTHMTGPRAAVYASYLVAAAALAFRRRYPLPSTLVVSGALAVEWLAFGAPEGFGVFATMVISGYSVAAHEDRGRALIGLSALAGTGAVWTLRDPTRTSYHGSLAWLSPVVIAWLLGAYLRTRRLYVAELQERTLRLEREREDRAVAAVAEERSRIARELHDIVGHGVSVMTVQASAVRRLLRGEQEREREALLVVERTGREALTEMRRMVGVLRHPEEAPALAPQPSLAYVERLVAQVREAGLAVDLRVEGEAPELPPGLDLTAYRLVQEALTNTLKHAEARRAEVVLRYGTGAVEVVVSDDGRGGGSPTDGGHGLVGMRERVAVYGGELTAGPRADGGFELRARLPLAPA